MRYTGLREGAGPPVSRCLGTFSLVADGGPVTEHLRVSFPATDRQAVDDLHRDAIAIGGEDAGLPGKLGGGTLDLALLKSRSLVSREARAMHPYTAPGVRRTGRQLPT
jgi:hypothetical protein